MNVEQFVLILIGSIFNVATFAVGVFIGASSCRSRNGVDDTRRE